MILRSRASRQAQRRVKSQKSLTVKSSDTRTENNSNFPGTGFRRGIAKAGRSRVARHPFNQPEHTSIGRREKYLQKNQQKIPTRCSRSAKQGTILAQKILTLITKSTQTTHCPKRERKKKSFWRSDCTNGCGSHVRFRFAHGFGRKR